MDLGIFLPQSLDFNLSAIGNVAVDFLLYSISGLKPVVLRKITVALPQARVLDRNVISI